ncbi:hypothetical protein MKEN_00144700 [Mycena kentingensis (nom. inval.)]|nr:hypothetical protein MKEN_00144700 [Mycena kentingensis (nom. inval.)]
MLDTNATSASDQAAAQAQLEAIFILLADARTTNNGQITASVLVLISADLILTVRIWILYRRSNYLLFILIPLVIIEAVAMMVDGFLAILPQTEFVNLGLVICSIAPECRLSLCYRPLLSGCYPPVAPRLLTYYTLGPLIVSTIMFVLTVYKCSRNIGPGRAPLLTMFLRDGLFWFLAVMSAAAVPSSAQAAAEARLETIFMLLSDARTTNYVAVATLAFHACDYISQFPKEVELVWKRRMSLSDVFYIWIRYFTLATVLANVLVAVAIQPSDSGQITPGVLVVASADLILAVRVWVLYRRTNYLLVMLIPLVIPPQQAMGRTKQQATTTTKKKKGNSKRPLLSSAADTDPPNPAEWAKLEVFQVLEIRSHKTREASDCSPGDSVAIFPGSGKDRRRLAEHEYWLAKIKEIRGTADGSICWIKVHWYYKAGDTKQYLNKRDISTIAGCAKMERLASAHSEIIAGASLSRELTSDVHRVWPEKPSTDRVEIHRFCEDDPDQAPIPAGALFTRAFFSAHWGNAVFTVLPHKRYPPTDERTKNAPFLCSLCREPYSPDEPDGVQHWCPAPDCRRGWHRKCLLGQNNVNGETTAHQLAYARIANVDSESKENPGPPALPPIEKLTMLVPPDLLLLAAQPIVRGGSYGVVGNVAIVLHARRFVHTALISDTDLELDRWLLDSTFNKWEDTIMENLGLGADCAGAGLTSLALQCPNCSKSI